MAPHDKPTSVAHIDASSQTSFIMSASESPKSPDSPSSSSSAVSQLEVIRNAYTRSDTALSAASTASLASVMNSAEWDGDKMNSPEQGVTEMDSAERGLDKMNDADQRVTEMDSTELAVTEADIADPGVTTRDVVNVTALPGGVRKRVTRRHRLTRPKGKREYKPRKDAIAKTLREEASKADFPLSTLEWSHWKKAAQRKNPGTSRWEARLEGRPGVRHTAPFDNTTTPAVYEVAVKVPDHTEKIPVLATVSGGISGQSWESALLSKHKLRGQVDRVIRRGCKLYVRRAPFSVRDMPEIYNTCGIERKAGGARSTKGAVSELRGLMARVCDYAWRDHYDVESRTYSHRGLLVNGVKVSD